MRIIDRGTLFDATSAPAEARFCNAVSLQRLSDNRLLAAFRTGSGKDSPDDNARIMLSADGGKTWETATAGFGDTPTGGGGRIRTAGPAEIAPGRVMAAFTWVNRSDPSLPLVNPETQGFLPTSILVAESGDSGRSWSPFQQVETHPHRGATTTGNLLPLRDGTLAIPYEAWKDYDDTGPGQHHAALRTSRDGGYTWAGPIIVAHDPEDRVLYLAQRLAINHETGRLVAMFWTYDRHARRDLAMHISWAAPHALSWTKPVSTGIVGQICAPVWLPGERLFAAHVQRHESPGIRAIQSADGGKTWAGAETLTLYEKPRGGSEASMNGRLNLGAQWADAGARPFGHPAAVRLSEQDVLVAYYAGDETGTSIHWVLVRV